MQNTLYQRVKLSDTLKKVLTNKKINVIIIIENEREVKFMYLVRFGREFVLPVDTLGEGMSVAVGAFKLGWEVDIINPATCEIMVSLRDSEVPYFSTSIHEVI